MSAVLQPGDAIRPMQEPDVAAVHAIEMEVHAFPWTRGIFQDCLRVGYCCWVNEQAGKVASYGIMSIAVGESHILNIGVARDQQRRGLGSRMLRHMLDLASQHGAETTFLEVRPSNTPALALYREFGFIEVGLRPGYYPGRKGREDAVILARQLDL